ncbi:Protein FAM13A isoform 1 [Schistosoma japonicum]|uniref:Protein FAM13A isoform 1 n=1 Tax=Schistosoma japonicum TaxID=6182 RepID=A0A4Z2CRP3_SCHJA|nr:Protein FAM13A isoform 1 [Schistosoma japonicum]
MVIERLMKKINVNPVPKKAFKPTATLTIPRCPTLTFGVPLKEVTERDKTEIPIVVSDIFNFLTNKGGFQSEGIFRVNGNSRVVEVLRTIIDENGSYWHLGEFSNIAGDSDHSVDVFSVASLLKLYLRKLPGGLIPESTTALFLKIYLEYRSKQDAYLVELEKLLVHLPVVNYTLLKHLCQFLHRVSVYQFENKMSTESLGIVFGPNVFRFTPENLGYREQSYINHIMTILIEHSNSLFRMIAPSCENVSSPNDLSSDSCTRIPPYIPFSDTTAKALENKKSKDKFELSNVNSHNDINEEEDASTESFNRPNSKAETNHIITHHITNTYCHIPQMDAKTSTSTETVTNTPEAQSRLTKPSNVANKNDCQFRHKTSSCDMISAYLEIAIRSCIHEHLFQEQLSNSTEKENNLIHSSAGINDILKLDYTDAGLQNITSINESNLLNSEWDHSKLLSTIVSANEPNDQILNRLTQYLHRFKARLREYEKYFEQNYGRKPTNADKYSDPKIAALICQMSEINAAIKQINLSGKRSPTCVIATTASVVDLNQYSVISNNDNCFVRNQNISGNSTNCNSHCGNVNEKMTLPTSLSNYSSKKQSILKFDGETEDHIRELLSPVKSLPSKPSISPNIAIGGENISRPLNSHRSSVESTFLILSNRLTEKRLLANRPEDLHMMTPKQIAAEKLALQKCLLYFENLHGRPKEQQDRITMRPLYDRYRNVKRLLNSLQSNKNFNFPGHTEENSDAELQSSVPSTDDLIRRRSIVSPNMIPLTNADPISNNSTVSFKSSIPHTFSSLHPSDRLSSPISSLPEKYTRIPPLSSISSTAALSSLPIYSSITSHQFTHKDNDYLNSRINVTQKQPLAVTSTPSVLRSSHYPNAIHLSNPIDVKQSVNTFVHNKRSTKFDSNVDSLYKESECDAQCTNSRNCRIQAGGNNSEWFGTVGLSKRTQSSEDYDYHGNTVHCHSKLTNEMDQYAAGENTLSSISTCISSNLYNSVRYSNAVGSEYSPYIHQENFVVSKLAFVTSPSVNSSTSFSNPKIIEGSHVSDALQSNNTTEIVKNRRRILAASENAINNISSNNRHVDSSQGISSSDLSSWSVADLKTELRSLRESKRQLQKTLKDFEHEFTQSTGKLNYYLLNCKLLSHSFL